MIGMGQVLPSLLASLLLLLWMTVVLQLVVDGTDAVLQLVMDGLLWMTVPQLVVDGTDAVLQLVVDGTDRVEQQRFMDALQQQRAAAEHSEWHYHRGVSNIFGYRRLYQFSN
jgi:Na+-driven multidrug efflux pump